MQPQHVSSYHDSEFLAETVPNIMVLLDEMTRKGNTVVIEILTEHPYWRGYERVKEVDCDGKYQAVLRGEEINHDAVLQAFRNQML
jgi:hypothetical protein